ncbi:MAG: VOC family protein [Alphaproteobacteria bacterium]|jgi:catechol 2,3-dioxygenase-like lactoylglutathione lyase family enzyme|nr:VOC family protein [Rhodospirillaceae bacterium]MBT6203571.1 VOC family protein [Rhodospirillaceae bacterium]MBT6511696.1 VOC family protein [Rhodospirillaceae bacterium]MBT7614677.1 VOC family protein [Rhodospirillaceae bacterium]MDG2481144.1 VOC family protein [Alphaproteobacteria bacterium]
MARVTGIGGVFFKSDDPKALADWYRDVLGLETPDSGVVTFVWGDDPQPGGTGHTVLAPFARDTHYFEPSDKPFMLNFRVDDLDGMLVRLREAGADVNDTIDIETYGRFCWFIDPEGNKIELWEPNETAPY